MSLRCFLAPLPAVFDLPQMTALTVGRYSKALDVNVVDNGDGTKSLAVYFDSYSPPQTSLNAWQSDVSSAVVQHPTADEQAATAAANAAAVQQRLQSALAANATFLASVKPGTASAQANAAYDQAVRLTKQNNALIRLALGALSDISDTA